MSDMSFKQAKEISERLELSELTLKAMLKNVESSTTSFETLVNRQELVYKNEFKTDNKITNLKVLIALNIGFIIGLLVSKYIF